MKSPYKSRTAIYKRASCGFIRVQVSITSIAVAVFAEVIFPLILNCNILPYFLRPSRSFKHKESFNLLISNIGTDDFSVLL